MLSAAMKGFVAAVALIAVLAVGCGNPQEDTGGADTEESTTTVEPPAATSTTGDSSPVLGTPTPIPGLTDTGYLTFDGRPLYAECMAEGLSLPPDYSAYASPAPEPTPSQPQSPTPAVTPDPDFELPPFAFPDTPPADTSGWNTVTGLCFDYSLKLPAGYTTEVTHVAYDAGEKTIIRSPSGRDYASLEYYALPIGVTFFDSPASRPDHIVLLSEERELSSKPARFTAWWDKYAFDDAESNGVVYRFVADLGGGRWVYVLAVHGEPYSLDEAASIAGLINSIEIP